MYTTCTGKFAMLKGLQQRPGQSADRVHWMLRGGLKVQKVQQMKTELTQCTAWLWHLPARKPLHLRDLSRCSSVAPDSGVCA